MAEYPKQLELDGIYFRVNRDNKWVNICLSDLTYEEKENVLHNFDHEQQMRTLDIICGALCDAVYQDKSKVLSTIERVCQALRSTVDKVEEK